MSAAPVVFSATGAIQFFPVTIPGTYVIEAAGAQGGAGGGPGGKGARVSGMFYLKRGDILKIVAGSLGTPAAPPHHLRGGGGGSSMIWTGPSDLPAPIKLMLSARGGKGGAATSDGVDGSATAASSASDPVGTEASEIGASLGRMDRPTADALTTQWTRGAGAESSPRQGGAGQVDRCGYNAGSFRSSTPDAQLGDGYVSITPVSVPASPNQPPAPASPPASPAVTNADPAATVPSQTMLPRVTPRLRSWENLLRRRRP